jgi:hypothetical protein
MTAAITTLRSTLATDLTNTGVWNIFSFPPATLIPNSVVITPSDPYLVPSNGDYSTVAPTANFKILMAVPSLNNQSDLSNIETMIVAVFNKLASSSLSISVTSVSAPAIASVASGDLLTSDITVSILTSWS